MSTVLRSLKLMIGADFSQAQKGFKEAAKEFKQSGKQLTDVGGTLTKGLTVPIMAAATGLGAMVKSSIDSADELAHLADVTGLSTDRLQELKYAGTKLDVELETMTGAQSKLIRAMSAARDGTGDQAEAFKALGISITDSQGNLRDSNDVFAEAIDALGKVGNETEADAIALKLFGKSALELNPLIKAGSDQLAALSKEAHKNGAVMSSEAVKSLDEFGDEMDAMMLSVKSGAGEIAEDLLPIVKDLAKWFKESLVPAVKSVLKWFADLSPAGKKTALAIAGIAAAIGPALTAFGKLKIGLSDVMKTASKAMGVLGSVKSAEGLTGKLGALGVGPGSVIAITVAALGGLALALNSAGNASRDATQKSLNYLDTLDDSARSYNEQIDAINGNASAASALADKLFALSKKENLSNAEKQRMVALVAQLNDLVPGLNLEIDAQTGLLNKNESAVRGVIAARREEIMLNAYEERLGQLYTENVDLIEKQKKAQERYNKILAERNRFHVEFGTQGTKSAAEFQAAKKELESFNAALAENISAISTLENAHDALTPKINTTIGAYNSLTSSIKQANSAMGTSFNGLNTSKMGARMTQYAVGTDYVPRTGPAILHQGEAVIPAAQNNRFGRGSYTLNVNGATDARQIAGLVVQRLRQAGAF